MSEDHIIKTIAVWGSSGAGKTLTSLAIATELAAHKQNVVVINTDTTTPALPVYLPRKTELDANSSVGTLLSQRTIDMIALNSKIHIHPHSDRIGFMGLVSGETPLTYSAFEREKMLELLGVFAATDFDYVIFDCLSNTTNDELSFLALEVSDHVVRVFSPDVKGIEFCKSQDNWLRGAGSIDVDKHIRVCSGAKKRVSPIDQVRAVYSFDYLLPYSPEAESKFIAGELIKGFNETSGIDFKKAINRLVKERLLV